jgi:hypothetical protein
VAEQRHGHGVDAGLTGVLTSRQRWQFAEVAARQVLADIDELGRDQVEIVEEPLGRRRDEGAFADILGELAVSGVERPRVVTKPGKNAPGVALLRVDREMRRERKGSLIEPLRAQRFVAKGPIAVPIGLA